MFGASSSSSIKPSSHAASPVFMSTLMLTRNGVLPPTRYTVENLSCKAGATRPKDYMTLRIRMTASHELDPYERVIIKLCPSADQKDRRNQGRPECGFVVEPLFGAENADGDDDDAVPRTSSREPHPNGFYEGKCYSVVLNAQCKIAEIYFSVADCNYEPTGPPKWIVVADASAILARFPELNGRWKALPLVHPNPDIDAGTPLHMQPQRAPRWFGERDKCKKFEVFLGQLSASKLWAFIGGEGRNAFLKKGDFDGNMYTRFGRDMEPCVALALLLHFQDYVIHEVGTFRHPTLVDVCASPDGIIDWSTHFTSFNKLPGWVQSLIRESLTEQQISQENWSRGVFECKVMKKRNQREDVPKLKAEHVCQMYLQMICAGCWWGDLVRYCAETGDCFRYRVYRQPVIANMINSTIQRMHRELTTEGHTHASATDHQTNQELVRMFRHIAQSYNTPENGTIQYTKIEWPQECVDRLLLAMASVDIVHCQQETSTVNNMQIDQVNAKASHQQQQQHPLLSAGVASSSSVTAKEPKTKRARKDPGPTSDSGGVGGGDDDRARGIVQTTLHTCSDRDYIWDQFMFTTRRMGECLKEGFIDELVDENVIPIQIVRLVELQTMIMLETNLVDQQQQQQQQQHSQYQQQPEQEDPDI